MKSYCKGSASKINCYDLLKELPPYEVISIEYFVNVLQMVE